MGSGSRFSLEAILTLKDNLTGPMGDVHARLTRASRTLRRSFEDLSRPIANVNRAINRGLLAAGAGITAFAVAGVRANIEYSDAVAKVASIADTAAVSLAQLRREMLSVSDATGRGAAEVAEATYQAISAGVGTADAVAFVETATRAATAGFTSTSTAVDALTSTLNAYGLAAGDATRISDQLLTAQNYGKTTFGELAGAIGQVLPIASALGVQTDELFGSIAALTKQGQSTSQAVTGVRAALSNVIQPSAQARAMAAELGIEFSAAALEAKGLSGFLDDLGRATGGDTAKLARLFGSVEALNAVLALTGAGAEDFRGALDAMANSAGATGKAFDAVANSPGFRLRLALNRIRNAGIRLGDALSPAIDAISNAFTNLAGSLNQIDHGRITGFVNGAISLVTWGARLWPILVGLAAGFKVAAVGIRIFGMSARLAVAGPVIAGVAAVIAGLILLVRHWDEVKAFATRTWDSVRSGAQHAWNAITTGFSNAWGAVRQSWQASGIREWAEELGTAMRALYDWLVERFVPIGEMIARPFIAAFEGMREMIMAVWASIRHVVEGISGAMGAVGSFFNGRDGMSNEDRMAADSHRSGLAHMYAGPRTTVAESRQYRETVNRSEVFVRPDRGATLSRTRGGIPEPSLAVGVQ